MKLQRRLFKANTLIEKEGIQFMTQPSSHGVTLTIKQGEQSINVEQRFLTTTCLYLLPNDLVITHHFGKLPATIELSNGTFKQDGKKVCYLDGFSVLDHEQPQLLVDFCFTTLEELAVLIVLDQLVSFDD